MEFENTLLETSFLISFALEDDIQNKKAKDIFDQIKFGKNLYITNVVNMEIATILSQRKGKEFLSKFYSILEKAKVFTIILNDAEYALAEKDFLALTSKNISFFDLTTAIIAKNRGIECVIAFDKHFKSLGKLYKFHVFGV